jgi:site-specific recombinase XerC
MLLRDPAQAIDPRTEHTDLLDKYTSRLLRLNFARTTQHNYRSTLRRFFRYYPNVRLERLTPEHIERYLWSRSLSPRSIWTELETLRAFFAWTVRQERLLARNPCDGVERPRWKEKTRPAPAWTEMQALLRACHTPEERAMVEVFCFTGLRVSELRMVRLRDLDLSRRRIRVVGKGDKERTVVFPARTAEAIDTHLGGRTAPDGWLWQSTKHPAFPRGVKWIESLLHRLGRDAGLPYHLTAHLLRHGFVRLCKTREVPIEVTARLAGHNSIKTTAKLYGAMDIDDLQSSYDRHIGG